MGKKKVMLPADEVDLATVKYQYDKIEAPHLTGFSLKLFVKLLETPLIGSLIISRLKKDNKMIEMLRNTVIPEPPMFKPEFPPQESESEVIPLDENGKPEGRVELALKSLPDYDPAKSFIADSSSPFRYWKIRDYAYAYRSKLTTPSIVAERFILAIDEFKTKKPPTPLLISYDPELIRKQAAASTRRFEEGNPLSILDGIFIAIKDDIDCCPHPSKGGTTFFHEIRPVEKDAPCVARLRTCGVILVGKANMHELGLGTTGNNPNHGTTRNPHDPERYTGGSSSGPAAIVASGLCSAALGTDGGGSVRIPSSLCGVVGLKSTYGRTDMKGSICDSGTVEIIGPITSTVEDAILVYAAILGSSTAERIALKPSPPCLPNLTSHDSRDVLGSLRLGKYTEWFNDVFSTDISAKCEDVLNRLLETHGCKTVEIVIPELHEMRNAHIVSIGSESASGLYPDYEDGKKVKFTLDTRTNLALFQSFSATDYVAAQSLRRRLMYYHTEILKNVDVIVTPTTGMTAPVIPPAALSSGETDLQVSGNLMRFVVTANLLGFPAISVPVLKVFSNLAQTFANPQTTEGSEQLSQRIWGIIQKKIFKAKEHPRDESVELPVLEPLLEKYLKLAAKPFKRKKSAANPSKKKQSASWNRHKMLNSLAQSSIFWILKIIDSRNFPQTELQKVCDIFQNALVAYFDSKKSQMKCEFLKETFKRRPWIGRHLFGFLLEKCGSAKSQFRQVEALDLVTEILKSQLSSAADISSADVSKKMLKTHLPKLCHLIKHLVSNMPEKQTRRADVRKFCGKVFQILKTFELDASFLKSLEPEGHTACESQLGDVFLALKK